jgi:hypothetical protein
MEADTQAHVAFYLTGRRPSKYLDAVDDLGLKPALFAGFRELTRLRYDFPLVLVNGLTDAPGALSLSALIDDAVRSIGPVAESARIRQQALRVEQDIRTQLAAGASGTLSTLWSAAVERVGAGADDTFADSATRVRKAIRVDGPVVDCDAALPARLVSHIWRAVHEQKATSFRKEIDRLVFKLSNILRADLERSEAGRSAERLQASVGAGFGNSFDFDALAKLLGNVAPKTALPERRRTRIRDLIDVLHVQRFYPSSHADAPAPYAFQFDRCADALAAYRERMSELTALVRAIAIAELEIDNQYNEAKHDALFEQFGANGLDPRDLTAFPDYLVCTNASALEPADHAQLMEILSSGLPIKVLLQIDDILEESPYGEGNLTTGMRSRQLASMAIGLNEAYVLQSSSSNLPRYRERIVRGLTARGPALFSIFSGASGAASGLSPYLVAAAAMESRAFPAFTYDPSAGPNWAARFSLEANTQVELDWPVQDFAYEDEQQQRVTEHVAFTVVDFVASDTRYARHLARVPRRRWNGSMIAVDESLHLDRTGTMEQVPSVLMIDDENVLQRVIVDERLLREARRCREMWHSLQELGGVHNSHAEILVRRERRAWEAAERALAEARDATAVAATVAAVTAAIPAVAVLATTPAAAAEPERNPDEAYIETTRCSTCNECTHINNKMFAYNANKQAYIADVSAGTYAQLVEAAESCQVSVIHPGKPRNPNEPGLERLLERAAAFA